VQRFIFVAFLIGIYMTISGGYDTWIQLGTSGEPTTVTASELSRRTPSNRYLKITDACLLGSAGVVYYRTRHYKKVEGSELTFIPVIPDSNLSVSEAPRLLLKITDEKMKRIKDLSSINHKPILGTRKTHFELDGKVKEFLEKHYGKSAADNIIVVEYGELNHDELIFAILKLIGGLVILGFIFRPNQQMIKEGFNFSK